MRRFLDLQLICLFCTPFFLTIGEATAGLAPESVLLVVNGNRPASLAVANEYAVLRGIPPVNVVVLTRVANVEQLTIDEFREQVLGPVLAAIKERRLESQIDCVTYSADLPTAIHITADIGDRKLPQILTPVASINGLTFLHQLTMAKDIRYLDLRANFYARRIIAGSGDLTWQPDELRRYAEAMQHLQDDSRRRQSARPGDQAADAMYPVNDPLRLSAIDVLLELKRTHPQSADLLYNVACGLAVVDRAEEALATLQEAIDAGWFDHGQTSRDPDFKSLHSNPEFKLLLQKMKSVHPSVQPAKGFRGEFGWAPGGDSSQRRDLPRFLLSTVLGVTTGRGNSVADVITNLQRSASSDGTRPGGTIYFMRNGDVRSTTREWGFTAAVEKLKSLGVDAAIENGVLPQRKDRVAGAMVGSADFDWAKSESKIVPGAIVEHLTSFGGVMTTGAGQTPLTEFVRSGAAGASGTVTEPFAIQAKFPTPFLHVFYASGCSLAEAFYQSVSGPYQLLIVGDPITNPWRRDFSVMCQTPPMDKPWQGTVALHPVTQSTDGIAAADFSLFVDGIRRNIVPAGQDLEFDTRQLDDGDHQITVLARGGDAVETIARWTSQITVQNGNEFREVIVKCDIDPNDPSDQRILVTAVCRGATQLNIMHFGRIVAEIKGETGKATIDAKAVGSGPVALQPVAVFPDKSIRRGRIMSVSIPHPAPQKQ